MEYKKKVQAKVIASMSTEQFHEYMEWHHSDEEAGNYIRAYNSIRIKKLLRYILNNLEDFITVSTFNHRRSIGIVRSVQLIHVKFLDLNLGFHFQIVGKTHSIRVRNTVKKRKCVFRERYSSISSTTMFPFDGIKKHDIDYHKQGADFGYGLTVVKRILRRYIKSQLKRHTYDRG